MVAPKKARLFEAESELQAQMNTLNAKRAQLQGVLDKLQASISIIPYNYIILLESIVGHGSPTGLNTQSLED